MIESFQCYCIHILEQMIRNADKKQEIVAFKARLVLTMLNALFILNLYLLGGKIFQIKMPPKPPILLFVLLAASIAFATWILTRRYEKFKTDIIGYSNNKKFVLKIYFILYVTIQFIALVLFKISNT